MAAASLTPRPRAEDSAQTRYAIGEVLAVGGMGTIFRAFDHLTQRDVAYKRLRIDREAARPRLTALFQREYDTLARLTHPNIVEVYDYGFDPRGPYYTMELLSGDDLTRVAPMPFREACRVLRDVASALALLHARRLVHRDVSPNNVRLTRDGRAKLIDFGALMRFGAPKELVGTANFIAPESLRGDPLDQRADLYALGALAYWTLTGSCPYPATCIDELAAAFECPPALPSQRVAGLPPELDELIMALLQHDRGARPATAAHLIERLTSIAQLAPERNEREVVYSYLAHTPLIERSEAREQLDAALAEALASRGGTLSIEGMPGLGRSALIAYVAIQAQLAGATVLRATGSYEGAFGLARHLTDVGLATYPDVASALHVGAQEEGGAGHDEPVRDPVEALERDEALAASLRERLVQLALRSPLVLLVDDAHRADPESLALLRALAPVMAHSPMLLVLTAPSHGPERARPSTLDPAVLAGSAGHIALAPLSEAGTLELVQTIFGGVPHCLRVARWLMQEGGGNPARMMDLLRRLLQSGAIRYTLGTFTLPHDLDGESLAERAQPLASPVGDLSEDASRIAQLLSLHDGTLAASALAAASALSRRSLALAIEQLVARGVVLDPRPPFAIASESLRKALTASLSEERRRQLHVTLARALMREHDRESLEQRFSAGQHLLAAGPRHEREGAAMIAHATAQNTYEVALSARRLPVLEAALAIYRRLGKPERACLPLLIALSAAGFYGDLASQGRHLEPTLAALADVSGLSYAERLAPWLGRRLSLYVGLTIGFLRALATPHRAARFSPVRAIQALLAIASAGVAASASAIDPDQAQRILRWLDPIRGFSTRSAPAILRQFCVASVEMVTGRLPDAMRRFTRVQALLASPVRGVDERVRAQLALGCLHCRGQISAMYAEPHALMLADMLEQESSFFASHAAGVRMAYHGQRGEHELVEQHRARAEALALRGTRSWSAQAVLAFRMQHACLQTGDVMGIVRTQAAFERLAQLGPGFARRVALSDAHLALLQGRPERALAAYEQLYRTRPLERWIREPVDLGMYMQALGELGRHEEIKARCTELLRHVSHLAPSDPAQRVVLERLALAEAALGEREVAAARLDDCIAHAEPGGNPLVLGSLHRDRAQVALLANDAAGFERHFTAMLNSFSATRNPSLLQQVDALHARAVRAGLRAAPPIAPISNGDVMTTVVLRGAGRETPSQPPPDESGGPFS